MNIKDLIKKLEQIELPEIEIPGHKEQLKKAILAKYFKEQPFGVFYIFKKAIIPLSGAIALILFITIAGSAIFPQYISAKIKEIALQDPQIKEWVAKGAEIKDIKIKDNKAYVLVSPKEILIRKQAISLEAAPPAEKEFSGAIVEIHLNEKKVSKIEVILPTTIPLTNEEVKEVKEIIEKSEVNKYAPQTIELETIEPLPLPANKLRFNKQKNEIEAFAEEQKQERAKTIHKIDGQKLETLINIKQGQIENVRYLEESEKENESDE